MRSQSPYADDEPTAPSTQYILVGVGVDPSGPDTVALAYAEVEPTPYAVPDKEQPGVIEPTGGARTRRRESFTQAIHHG